MKCQNCQRIVTQEEAHAADELFPDSGLTLCEECAASMADDESYEIWQREIE